MENAAKNMEWMYDGTSSKLHEEDYLLGKKITKIVDDNETFMGRGTTTQGDTDILEKLDYDNKIREDPLFAIKQKELEHRKEVLTNPLKKKKIQTILKHALEKDLEKSKHKKHKKKKKRKKYSSSDSDSSELDEEVIKKSMKNKNLRNMLKQKLKKDLHKNSSSDSGEDKKRERKKSSDHGEKNYNESKHLQRIRKNSNSENDEKKREYGLTNVKYKSKFTDEERRKKREMRNKMPSPKREQVSYKRKHEHGFTSKLNKDELERKRREMMSSADVRNDQRKKNVESFSKAEQMELKYEEAVRRKQSKHEEEYGVKGKDFVHSIKMKNASGGSLSDTVRRRKHKMSSGKS